MTQTCTNNKRNIIKQKSQIEFVVSMIGLECELIELLFFSTIPGIHTCGIIISIIVGWH